MICWAFSWLSQKFGPPIWAVNLSRSESLAAMSKRVPELRETADHLVGTASQVGVHVRAPFAIETRRYVGTDAYYTPKDGGTTIRVRESGKEKAAAGLAPTLKKPRRWFARRCRNSPPERRPTPVPHPITPTVV